jgi:FAD:protein FMN transferase
MTASSGSLRLPAIQSGTTWSGSSSAGAVRRYERSAMGSPLRLQIHGELSATQGEGAWNRASEDIEATEQALSRFRDDSELTLLNRAIPRPEPVATTRRLYRALAEAERAWRVTGGWFDPRILRDLERMGYRGVPQGAAVSAADDDGSDARSTWRRRPWLVRHPRRHMIELLEPVDLGGIGKGLALRWAWHALSLPRSVGALLEAGGDLVLGGPTSDGGPWMVGIEDPAGAPGPLAVTALRGGALCTSSVRINHWVGDDGRPLHHLVDPRTGQPGGAGLLAVSVAAADPAWAEVWSKTLFLLGRSRMGDAARRRGLAAWWVEADGSLHMTPAARPLTAWTAA